MPSPVKIEHSKSHQKCPPIYHQGCDQCTIDTCIPQKQALQQKKCQLHGISRGHYPGTLIPKNHLQGLCSMGYWNVVGHQDWGLHPHRNEGVELVCLETGQMPFLLEDKIHPLKAHTFTITRPWQKHCHGYPTVGPGRMHWFIIDVDVRRPNDPWKWPSWVQLTPSDLKELTRILRQNETPYWNASKGMLQLFRSIAPLLRQPEPERSISHITIALNQLLLEVLEILRKLNSGGNAELSSHLRTVDLFLKDIAANPASASNLWTLPEMAKHCGMGMTSFVEYCTQLTNTSPMNFLNRCRLNHAAHELKTNPEKSILDIAIDSGFSTSQYFATLFKRQYGHPPGRHREKREYPPFSNSAHDPEHEFRAF